MIRQTLVAQAVAINSAVWVKRYCAFCKTSDIFNVCTSANIFSLIPIMAKGLDGLWSKYIKLIFSSLWDRMFLQGLFLVVTDWFRPVFLFYFPHGRVNVKGKHTWGTIKVPCYQITTVLVLVIRTKMSNSVNVSDYPSFNDPLACTPSEQAPGVGGGSCMGVPPPQLHLLAASLLQHKRSSTQVRSSFSRSTADSSAICLYGFGGFWK